MPNNNFTYVLLFDATTPKGASTPESLENNHPSFRRWRVDGRHSKRRSSLRPQTPSSQRSSRRDGWALKRSDATLTKLTSINPTLTDLPLVRLG